MSSPVRARHGSALVTALLGVLLLEAAIVGLLYVCTQEALIGRGFARRLGIRLAAESAVHAALAAWPADSLRALPPGGIHRLAAASGVLPGGASFAAEIERLHGGWLLVKGEGAPDPSSRPLARAAALVSLLDTAPFWEDFAAPVLSAAPLELAAGATLDGLNADEIPSLWDATACPSMGLLDAVAALGSVARPALATASVPTLALDASAVLNGVPPVLEDTALAVAGAFERIGPLTLDDVATLADRIESGAITLQPAGAGRCDTGATGNWGAAEDPTHTCADYVPLIYAPGDLDVLGGAGQGLLIVRGHLRLAPGTRFRGAILSLGGVTAPDVTVHGAIRVAADTSLVGGSIQWNACALWRAFTRPEALRRPYRRSTRWWLPVF